MEESAAVRRATDETVRDVVPDALREDISTFVADGSVVPGALTLLTADLFGGEEADHESVDGLVERGVGVQLIYDGLRLTRELVSAEPWTRGGDEKAEADMEILAADVMVSRGFYLLARTDAATAAVEVVRSFGRDQTDRRETGDASLDRNLERDVLELAVLAGASAVGADAPDARSFAEGLLDDRDETDGDSRDDGVDGFPDAASLFTESVRADLRALSDGEPGGRALSQS